MEARIKKYHPVSPERSKVWTEKSPKYQQCRKVPVVYYLSRNRQLEHPHFIEVQLSSPHGLYLRDVIEKLDVLRGRGMASMYSWSCKRSYKSGFVWHDLCEDDLIVPAHGTEYVLKGSELFQESHSGHSNPVGNTRSQTLKQLPEPTSRIKYESSSSASLSGKETKHSTSSSSGVSPESRDGKNTSWGGSLCLTEYKVYQSDGLADASTQTDGHTKKVYKTCTRGVSTDDIPSEPEKNSNDIVKDNSEICRDSVSPPASSSASSSGGKTDTLESLIKADSSKPNSFRILDKEEFQMAPDTKVKASNMLMQLISCGSISVKDNGFGLSPTYRPVVSQSKYPSSLFSTSLMLGELDCLTENPRFKGQRMEDKEYFSGSFVETNTLKVGGPATLKRSSSYNADRTNKFDSVEDKEETTLSVSKCIPLSMMGSFAKQPRSESMRSPLSDGPRISSDGADSLISTSASSSKRITDPSLGKKQSKRLDSFREDRENTIKIEERLASGARVVIQSVAHQEPDGPSWL